MAQGREAVIRVLDSGPGVPNDALEKIFQPFYRLDDARNRQTGGAGLGLSIADRAVRLHGGQMRASNRPEGGLEVEIRIPAVSAFALPAHS
jgi:two-component system sensor histidine kinase CpxA